jgi:hypothetical protein
MELTNGVNKWGADAITHVGIKGQGSDVYHHGSGPGWRKQSGYPISSNFAYGITLGGTGSATGDSSGDGSEGNGGGLFNNMTGAIGGGLSNLIGGTFKSLLSAIKGEGFVSDRNPTLYI